MQIRNLADIAKYDSLSIPDRQQTYDHAMSSDDRKRMGELRAFEGFVRASGLPVDPTSVECLDPPAPDIRCMLSASPYLFELGEVTDEGLARGYSHSLRTGEITGGFFSQSEPLEYMISSKADKAKKYRTDGFPVDLLLYYWKHPPYDPAIEQTLTRSAGLTHQILDSGLFARIWVYEHPQRILGVLTRDQATAKTWSAQKAKQATILLADIASPSTTKGAGNLFAEHAANEFLDRMKQSNDRNLGTFVKSTGDGAIAVFSDAQNALDCAAELQRSLSERPILVGGMPLEVRIGIHAGLVNMTQSSYGLDVFGSDVNLAARLTDLAKPGQVALSETARLALPEDRRNTLGLREMKTIKGFSKPIEVSRIDFSEVLAG
jgi:class 3 adenylate cyclase